MADAIIEASNLGKRYHVGLLHSREDNLRAWLSSSIRRPLSRITSRTAPKADDWIWALRHVNFEVQPGEVVGIIGRNGAGKSTLLKILSRITDPTEGSVHLRGRMASLIEVGTGFHPELTGRENVYLNGAILGMKKAEIDRKFDQIVAFSEVEKFLETPVKHYSSGMYLRLAFAVAAHLDPEILVVDEVLAVGDASFQKKCLGRMNEIGRGGRTVLFVSHNLTAVEHLCDWVVVLEGGEIVFRGDPHESIETYLRLVGGRKSEARHSLDLTHAEGRPPHYKTHMQHLELFSSGDPLRDELPLGASFEAVVSVTLPRPIDHIGLGIGFESLVGARILTAHTSFQPALRRPEHAPGCRFTCAIPELPLAPGEYVLRLVLYEGDSVIDVVADAARIKIKQSDFYGSGISPWNGVCVARQQWTVDGVSLEEVLLARDSALLT
jgi:homopolymeric O-antigen transport system ATP-binding protein